MTERGEREKGRESNADGTQKETDKEWERARGKRRKRESERSENKE